MAQRIAGRLQLPKPATLITNTDLNAVLILDLIKESVLKLRNEYPWPEMQREYAFALVTSTASYALPSDFNSVLSETHWNRTQKFPLVGPISPSDWQLLKSGQVASLPQQRFRVYGITSTRFFVDPTPTASENGQIVVFEYISKTCTRPKTWATGQTYAATTFTFYNGNFYSTAAGGITGATAPTHTSGTVTDGTVLWTYINPTTDGYFENFTLDADEVILNVTLIEDRVVWRFKEERGLSFNSIKAEAESQKEIAKTDLNGSSVVTVNQDRECPQMIGLANYPIGNYGI